MSYRWLTTRLQHAFTQKVVSCRLPGRIETNMQKREKSMGPNTDHGMPEQLLTRGEVAAWLQVSSKTLANWSSSGLGPTPLKLHGFVRYERGTVQAWINNTAKRAA